MDQEAPQDGITFFERAMWACTAGLAILAAVVVYLGVCALFSMGGEL